MFEKSFQGERFVLECEGRGSVSFLQVMFFAHRFISEYGGQGRMAFWRASWGILSFLCMEILMVCCRIFVCAIGGFLSFLTLLTVVGSVLGIIVGNRRIVQRIHQYRQCQCRFLIILQIILMSLGFLRIGQIIVLAYIKT